MLRAKSEAGRLCLAVLTTLVGIGLIGRNSLADGHVHIWTAPPLLQQPYILAANEYPRIGEITTLTVDIVEDVDVCQVAGCPFPQSQAWGVVRPVF